MKTIFEITDKEQKVLSDWKDKIKDLHGKYGLFTYKFTGTGISTEVRVYSHLTKIEIDLESGEITNN